MNWGTTLYTPLWHIPMWCFLNIYTLLPDIYQHISIFIYIYKRNIEVSLFILHFTYGIHT